MDGSQEISKKELAVIAATDALNKLPPEERQKALTDILGKLAPNISSDGLSNLSQVIKSELENREGATTTIQKDDGTLPLEGEGVEGLIPHIKAAQYDSFQEYSLSANRVGEDFQTRAAKDGRRTVGPYDVIDTTASKLPTPFRSPSVIDTLEDEFGFPSARILNSHRSDKTLLCVAGVKDGHYIVQGGGYIHQDGAGRMNPSSFELVFDNSATANDFIARLQKSPNTTLEQVFMPVMSKQGSSGQSTDTLFPTYDPTGITRMDQIERRPRNPFRLPIKELHLKNFDGQKVHQTFPPAQPASKA